MIINILLRSLRLESKKLIFLAFYSRLLTFDEENKEVVLVKLALNIDLIKTISWLSYIYKNLAVEEVSLLDSLSLFSLVISISRRISLVRLLEVITSEIKDIDLIKRRR